MKFKIGIITLTIGLLAGNIRAQESFNFTLQQAIEYAYQNQKDVKNANIDVEIAKAKVKETVAIGLPQVNGTTTFQKYEKLPVMVVEDFLGPGTGRQQFSLALPYNFDYGLEASQLLFDGSYIVGLQASNVYKELSTKAYSRSKIETNAKVSKAYYNVLVARKSLELLDANIAQLKKSLDDTKALNQNGFAEKIDADRLEVLYNNIVTEKDNATRMVELSNTLLKFQIGMPINSNLVLTDNLEQAILQQPVVSAEEINVNERIEYQLLKTQLKLNELDMKRYKFSRIPTVAAFGGYKRQSMTTDFSEVGNPFYPGGTFWGVRLSVPIIGSGKIWHQTKQAKLAVEKSKNDLTDLDNALKLESKNAMITYNNSVATLNNQRKNMELAAEILRVSKAKYDQGVGSSLEVTTAQTSLKESENNYINALYNTLVARIDLDKSNGKIQ